MLGVRPTAWSTGWLGRDSIGGSIWGYDRVIVPASRLLQRVVPGRLIGKNVLLIATKPDNG